MWWDNHYLQGWLCDLSWLPDCIPGEPAMHMADPGTWSTAEDPHQLQSTFWPGKSGMQVSLNQPSCNWGKPVVVNDRYQIVSCFLWHPYLTSSLLLPSIGKDWIRQLMYWTRNQDLRSYSHFSSSFFYKWSSLWSHKTSTCMVSEQISLALRSWGVPPVGWNWNIADLLS